MRTPTDPFGGGAMYHSMSIDGYLTPIGLVVVMPSTSWDVYGLLMISEYKVHVLEPKAIYRMYLGPAFGEPTDGKEITKLKVPSVEEVPSIDPSLRVPFGKAAIEEDITIVAWGRAVLTAQKSAQELSKKGIEAEVLDLRTCSS